MKNDYVFIWGNNQKPAWSAIFKAVRDLHDQGLAAYEYEVTENNKYQALFISPSSGLTDEHVKEEIELITEGI